MLSHSQRSRREHEICVLQTGKYATTIVDRHIVLLMQPASLMHHNSRLEVCLRHNSKGRGGEGRRGRGGVRKEKGKRRKGQGGSVPLQAEPGPAGEHQGQ